jgi:tetratricopeptide (TPR) repeat protein
MVVRFVLLSCLLWCSTEATGQTLTNLWELGRREYQAGHYAESESYFRAALEQDGLDDDTRAGILSDFGTLLLDQERPLEAEEAYTKALAIQKRRGDKRATDGASPTLGSRLLHSEAR